MGVEEREVESGVPMCVVIALKTVEEKGESSDSKFMGLAGVMPEVSKERLPSNGVRVEGVWRRDGGTKG